MKLDGILVFFETEIGMFAVALNLRETQIHKFFKNTFKDPRARICKFIIDPAYCRTSPLGGMDSLEWIPGLLKSLRIQCWNF